LISADAIARKIYTTTATPRRVHQLAPMSRRRPKRTRTTRRSPRLNSCRAASTLRGGPQRDRRRRHSRFGRRRVVINTRILAPSRAVGSKASRVVNSRTFIHAYLGNPPVTGEGTFL